MKKSVRKSVFETNSSSTHSLTMCQQSEYDDWKEGKSVLYNDKIISKESEEYKELLIEVTKSWEEADKKHYHCYHDETCTLEEYLHYNSGDWDCYTYEQFQEKADNYEESFEQSYTSKSGDEIVSFGYYGHD